MTKQTRDTAIIIFVCFIILVHIHIWNTIKSPHMIAIQQHKEQYQKEAEQLREKHKTAIYQELEKAHEEMYKQTINAHNNLYEFTLFDRALAIQEKELRRTNQIKKYKRVQVLKNIPPLSY